MNNNESTIKSENNTLQFKYVKPTTPNMLNYETSLKNSLKTRTYNTNMSMENINKINSNIINKFKLKNKNKDYNKEIYTESKNNYDISNEAASKKDNNNNNNGSDNLIVSSMLQNTKYGIPLVNGTSNKFYQNTFYKEFSNQKYEQKYDYSYKQNKNINFTPNSNTNSNKYNLLTIEANSPRSK